MDCHEKPRFDVPPLSCLPAYQIIAHFLYLRSRKALEVHRRIEYIESLLVKGSQLSGCESDYHQRPESLQQRCHSRQEIVDLDSGRVV
uniref:Uncharacterized protein n=1 Tax=uncultured marine group II/III euryarchaeote KM3_105_H04 TaxID=1457848 RepID=A0A075G537_9EURY|nr:hypothetical protein [uncultured marine group II/III euryarchaeote KM3_105_H04]